MNKLGIVIQARVGSSRLPAKVICPFYKDKTIIDILCEIFISMGYPIILATSNQKQDDAIIPIAKRHGVTVYRGSEQDVLNRFNEACALGKFEKVARVCADNPFLSPHYFKRLVEEAEQLNWDFDYLSFSWQGKPTILTHFGFFLELADVKALRKAEQLTKDPFYREHVTNYLYQNDSIFNICYTALEESEFLSPHIRLTVDTAEDFDLSVSLYAEVLKQYGTIEVNYIMDYLANKPELLDKMKSQILNNQK